MSSLHDLINPAPPSRPKGPFSARWLPVGLATGFLLLFAFLLRDRILPAPIVAVVPAPAIPRTAAAEADSSSADPGTRIQASGWLEADPQPFRATCLVNGVVDTVHAQEGDLVKEGDLLAVLVRSDAELARNREAHRLENAEAKRIAHLSAIEAAKNRLALAEAGVRAATAIRDEAEDKNQRMASLPPGAAAQADVIAAGFRLRGHEVNVEASKLEVEAARADMDRLEREKAVRDAEVAEADVEFSRAELLLERTRIAAPRAGRIMQFNARPGGKLMVDADESESATVAILYDPARLQVRVDVPLAEASRLRIGSPARVNTAVLGGRELTGTVTRVAGTADIQRNTLQFKVGLTEPPDALRPEMLCKVTFPEVSGAGRVAAGLPDGPVQTWIPREALADGFVWLCDSSTRRVSRRPVQLTGASHEQYLAVASGVLPGEWLVLSPEGLREGQRVRVGKGAP
jgi:multidrug efflux pump subunit AcrA (membrane-fusion protein)